jgi:hypothetical protein
MNITEKNNVVSSSSKEEVKHESKNNLFSLVRTGNIVEVI